MTEYAIYLESGPRMKTTMVHVPELLGCLANGPTTEEALERTPSEIRRFLRFLHEHGEDVASEAAFTTRVAQHVMEGPWIGYGDPAPGFEFDFEPLTRGELAVHMRRLGWLGDDLAEIGRRPSPEQLAHKPEKGRPLGEILRHICAAEAEYVRTAGAGKPEGARELIKAIEGSPEAARETVPRLWGLVIAQFEGISDEALHKVTQRGQSPYTARRGLRRALEHPWEHLREIERRLEAPSPPAPLPRGRERGDGSG